MNYDLVLVADTGCIDMISYEPLSLELMAARVNYFDKFKVLNKKLLVS